MDSLGFIAAPIALMAAGVFTIGMWEYEASHYDEHHATCMITEKDRGATSDGSSHYRLYTSCGVLADEDAILRGKTDSADLWGQLVPGHTYDLHVAGFRAPLFSQFPNILDAREIPAPTSVPATGPALTPAP